MIEDGEGNRRFYGLYRGTVADVKDPENKRRVKMTIPQVLGEEQTDWAWPMDFAGAYVAPPAVGQGVWVQFEGGDPSFPVWSSTFGMYRGKGTQVEITELPVGDYPATITRNVYSDRFDLIAALLDLADKVEEIRQSLNSHGGGSSESPPTDVAP